MFQTLDREQFSKKYQCTSTLTHSKLFGKKRLELRMNEMTSDGISQNITNLPVPHFNTLLYRTRSGIPTRIHSTSCSLLDYCFQASIWSILSINHRYRSRTFWVYSHDRKTHWCIESTFDSPLKSHLRLRLDSLLLFSNETAITSSIWMMFLSLCLFEDVDFIFLQ